MLMYFHHCLISLLYLLAKDQASQDIGNAVIKPTCAMSYRRACLIFRQRLKLPFLAATTLRTYPYARWRHHFTPNS